MLKIEPITVFLQGLSMVTVGGKIVSATIRIKPANDSRIWYFMFDMMLCRGDIACRLLRIMF